MSTQHILNKVRQVEKGNYKVHPKLTITTACGVVITKTYKKEMSPDVAQSRVTKILYKHIATCNTCQPKQP